MDNKTKDKAKQAIDREKRTGRKTARPWLDTNRLAYIWDKIRLRIALMIVDKLDKNGDAYRALSIPFGKCDGTSTSTVFTATVPGITELRDGVCMMLMNGVVTSAANCTLNINNLGAKPIYNTMTAATRVSTTFNVNYTMFFVYNETRVAGGAWDMYYGYNSDTNTIGYNLRRGQSDNVMKTALYRYEMVFTQRGGKLIPANATSNKPTTYTKTLTTEPFDPFLPIFYYSTTTTVNADAAPAVASFWTQYSTVDLRYAFNEGTTLGVNQPVFLVCEPQADGQVKLISGLHPISQRFPDTEDGYVYIYLGRAYSTQNICMDAYKPVYYFKNGAVRLWTNA